MTIHPHTQPVSVKPDQPLQLCCNSCGKGVSSAFIPLKTDTPDGGLIVRAWIECPECMEKNNPPEQKRRPHEARGSDATNACAGA